MAIDNIIVGGLVEGLTEQSVGILASEQTIRIPFADGDTFLPTILKEAGLFNSTSEVRQINKQRMKSDKFKNDPDQDLWRNLERPEMTPFKIGKKVFWLFVGERS